MNAIFLALGLALSPAAARPPAEPAAEFPEGAAWFNAKPLSLKMLRGRRAAVVAFLHPQNLQSLRTLAAVKTWFDRYALYGVMVIGVLTPDFEFQKNPLIAKRDLARWGIRFPVVQDNDRRLWKAYSNAGWPTLYLVDHAGRIVHSRVGEGGYEEFEKQIRAVIPFATGSPPPPPEPPFPEPATWNFGSASAELALGRKAAASLTGADAPPPSDNGQLPYKDGARTREGAWREDEDSISVTEPNRKLDHYLGAIYRGRQVFAALEGPLRGTKVFIRQDGEWLHPSFAGPDLKFDDMDRSYVEVKAPGLFELIRNNSDDLHELFLLPEQAGSKIYGLSFADQCQFLEFPR